jgi:hypothetical protein
MSFYFQYFFVRFVIFPFAICLLVTYLLHSHWICIQFSNLINICFQLVIFLSMFAHYQYYQKMSLLQKLYVWEIFHKHIFLLTKVSIACNEF